MNNKLLDDKVFAEAVTTCGQKIFSGEGHTNIIFKWELFKPEVKMKALERSGALNKEGKHKEARLRSSLDVCVKEECKSPGTFKDDIPTLKAQLEELDKEEYHDALVRARAERFLHGEAPTKRALGSEKIYAHKNLIVEIEHDAALFNDQASIQRNFCDYYEKLFARQSIDAVQFKNEFMCLLPCLSEEKTAHIESDITVDEVRRAIDELSPGKTPGPDGLTAAFHKKVKNDISPVLRNV